MGSLVQDLGRGAARRGSSLILAVMVLVVLTVATSGRAAAAPSSGQVMAWGDNDAGQLGIGKTGKPKDEPVSVSGLNGVTAISAGGVSSVALLSNGTVMQWGGAVGTVPVAVSGLSGVTAISAGTFDLALLSDGTVMQWSGSSVPVAVSGLSGVTAISAGGDSFGLALLSDGSVMAWGNNLYGELGDGTTEYKEVPTAVQELSGVTAISAGLFHSVALLTDGEVMTWGNNFYGQLGDGKLGEKTYEKTDSDVPVAVCAVGASGPCPFGPYLGDVTAVSVASTSDTLALLGDGTAVAWGYDGNGELGDGTTTTTGVPVMVSGLSDATALAAGLGSSLALLGNKTAMAWGENASGQLGDGTRKGPEQCPGAPCSRVPVAVSGLSQLVGIAAGGSYGLAFRAPGAPTVTKVNPQERLGGGRHVCDNHGG